MKCKIIVRDLSVFGGKLSVFKTSGEYLQQTTTTIYVCVFVLYFFCFFLFMMGNFILVFLV